MHSAIKKTIETDALKDAREKLGVMGARLDEIEGKLDRVLDLLERKPAPVQQQQGGGRR